MNAVGKFNGFVQKQSQEKKPAKRVADWKKGEELIGFYLEDKTFPGTEYGPLTYHYFVKAEIKKDQVFTDDEVVALRSGAGLANQLKDLKKGQLVKITYHGKEKNQKTGRSFHKFSCERADTFYQPTEQVQAQQEEFDVSWDD